MNRFTEWLIAFGVGLAFGLFLASRLGVTPNEEKLQHRLEAAERQLKFLAMSNDE